MLNPVDVCHHAQPDSTFNCFHIFCTWILCYALKTLHFFFFFGFATFISLSLKLFFRLLYEKNNLSKDHILFHRSPEYVLQRLPALGWEALACEGLVWDDLG